MKRFVIFFLFAVFMIIPVFAITTTIHDEEEPEEILLGESSGDDPTSLGGCIVQAWLLSSAIRVDISNYSGYVTATATGIGGVSGPIQAQIVGSGQIYLDISLLPEGYYYTLTIQAGRSYFGLFKK
ncbi:MAG: hypothetical protein IKH24_02945 [Bacteroidales bacterium]|nr:hypothetical protein [Bacteroidales bacterium]